MPINIVIDCDPGGDDALALMLAENSPELNIVGISTVAGVTSASQAAINACKIMELAGRNHMNIITGASQPLLRTHEIKDTYGGKDGLCETDLAMPSKIQVMPMELNPFYRQVYEKNRHQLNIVSIGPMTNLARYLQWGGKISQIFTASGNYGVYRNAKKVNPRSSWNLKVDPEAAEIVFQAVPKISVVGLDISLNLNNEMVDWLLAYANPDSDKTKFFIKAIEFNKSRGLPPYSLLVDSLAVAQLIDPALVRYTKGTVQIDTKSEILPGNTVFENVKKANHQNVRPAYDFNFGKFLNLLLERVLS